MGKINVYLPDDLERAVRDSGIPVSSVCQSALRAAVDSLTTIRSTRPLGPEVELTPRLRDILATGPASAIELLGAIILHGENVGARVLADLGIELPPPRPRAKRRAAGLSAEVRDVLAEAYRVALELQHHYVGAEHVVIALAEHDATATMYAALGLDERSVRSRVVHLLTNPSRTAPPGPAPEVLDRFEADLRRLSAELQELRSSAKLAPWRPTTSS